MKIRVVMGLTTNEYQLVRKTKHGYKVLGLLAKDRGSKPTAAEIEELVATSVR